MKHPATTWVNWARDQRCAPASFARPPDEAGVSAYVRQAAGRGVRVRAVGSGHSFNDVACTDGVMLDLSTMQRILDIDQRTDRVTVERWNHAARTREDRTGPACADYAIEEE